jgi:hypothetical protein
MAIDQLRPRSEVAVVSLVEVSAFADQSEILMLTLKRDVPEVGRQSHALRCTKVRQQKMESSLFSFAKKVWPRMKIGKVGSAVLLVEVCKFRVFSVGVLHGGWAGKQSQQNKKKEESRRRRCFPQWMMFSLSCFIPFSWLACEV